jgi:pimeloyl-ACP methyl ester carboxylesterase
MTDYATGRDAAYASRLRNTIEEFASQYGANPSTHRRTIFLFPGGLGSQLMRANKPHPQPPQYYEKSWIDCGILSGDGPGLRMLPGNVDFEEKYVVPDGGVDFVLAHPYNNFIQWCRNNWIDLFVFGWDWRRSVQDSADFFLKVFMPMLDTRFAGQTPHPLDHFTLVGHSAGGMVVKMILNASADQYVQRMKKAITVATPFYGYGGQTHRYLKGEPDLNWTEGANGASTYTKIISSMPGMYEFLLLDHETYEVNKVAFASDPEGFNLKAYPSLDKADPNEVADPYDPQPDAQGLVRYPLNHGFDSTLLYKGRVESRKVSSALADPATAAKLYNIRGVQTRNGNPRNNTVVSHVWARVPASFDPDTDTDPIEDTLGPGDDTQPAWTTRLLGLPDPMHQVITVLDDAEHMHMTMMGNPKVQTKIAELLGLNPTSMMFVVEEEFVASRTELNGFLDGVRKLVVDKELEPARRKIVIVDYFRGFKPVELHKLFARAYLDALRSPSQKTGPKSGSGRAKESGTPARPPRKRRR